ncbi:MAG: hypothetical protein RJA70_583 [Pseudomonadota bacterium]|jgi:uncharacterized tellurite resistance protein B-like protein
MDEEMKRLVCRMVAGLVASDEDFDDSERAFLDKVLTQFEVPEDEWGAIFPLVEPEEAATAMRSLDTDTQRVTFELLMEGALADGKIAPEEATYLRLIGEAIGMDAASLDARVKVTN